MVGDNRARLRILVAEIHGEVQRIELTVSEIDAAQSVVNRKDFSRLSLYGTAALLETFYTGVEKILSRVATVMGASPEGPAWHRRLLDEAILDLPKMRPPVIRRETAKRLEPYLAFRHRFRNLYLFDLEKQLLLPLVNKIPNTWDATSEDLRTFCAKLEEIADNLEP